MLEITAAMKDVFSSTREAQQRYGEDAATQFAALNELRVATMAAFDLLAKETETVGETRAVAYSFDLLWGLLEQERQSILAEVENNKQ